MTTTTAIFRNCFGCDYKAVTDETRCPKCGRTMKSSAMIRTIGGSMTFMGLLLTGIMVWVFSALSGSERGAPTGRYGETVRDASTDSLVFLILAAVVVMAGMGTITGLWLLVTGRRNLKLQWTTILMGIGLAIVAIVFNLLH